MLSFHVKFVQTDRRTDGQIDGQTDNGKTICPPDLSIRGHKNSMSENHILKMTNKINMNYVHIILYSLAKISISDAIHYLRFQMYLFPRFFRSYKQDDNDGPISLT